MRKLTVLTVALSLSAAGQAFAGEPHAPAAHTPAAQQAQQAKHLSISTQNLAPTPKQSIAEIIELNVSSAGARAAAGLEEEKTKLQALQAQQVCAIQECK